MKPSRLIIAALAAAGIATAAHGGSVNVQFVRTGLGRNVRIHLADDHVGVFAGQLVHEFSGATSSAAPLDGRFVTYCIELVQYVTRQPQAYELRSLDQAPGSDPMGHVRAQAIGEVFAQADGAQWASEPTTDSRDFAAAFQIALWEIVSDYDGSTGSLDVGEGNLTVTGYAGGALSGSIRAYLDVLFGVVGSGVQTPEIHAVTSPHSQDQVVLIPLPAPILMGLAALALVAWRQRRHAAGGL